MLQSLVSFRQVRDQCTPKVHPDLLDGTLAVDAVRSAAWFLQPDQLYALVGELDPVAQRKVADYQATTDYQPGDRVRHTDQVYVCRKAVKGTEPTWNGDYWETDLSAYLRRQYADAVHETLTHLITENASSQGLKLQQEHTPVFEERSTLTSVPGTTGRFRAVAFWLPPHKDLSVTVARVGFRASSPQVLPFYLYHSSQTEAIATCNVEVTPTDAGSWCWKELQSQQGQPLTLSWWGRATSVGGVFWLGFYEDDLQGEISLFEAHAAPIRCCHGLRAYACLFGAEQLDKPRIPKTGAYYTGHAADHYTAFNLTLDMRSDYTQAISGNIGVVAKAFQYDLAVRLLEEARNSPRLNDGKQHLHDKLSAILDDRTITGNNGFPRTEKGLLSTAQDYRRQVKLDLLPQNPLFTNNFG
jgi:hypothetical protein